MAPRHDYYASLCRLMALCGEAATALTDTVTPPLPSERRTTVLTEAGVIYGDYMASLSGAFVTPLRKDDLVDIAAGLCETLGALMALPALTSAESRLVTGYIMLTSLELQALCGRGNPCPSTLPDTLPIFFEGARQPHLAPVCGALLRTHHAVAAARMLAKS